MSPTALSYADRAKRAQRSSLDNTVHAVSVSMSVSTASSSLSYSTPSSSSTSSTASNGTVISSDSTDVDTADTTAPTTSNSSVIVESDCEGNGEQKVQLKGKDREKEEIRSPTRKPTVNVWQQRMAEAKQLGAKRDSTPSSLTTPKPPTSSPPEVTDEDDDPFIVKVRPAPTSWSNRPSLASPSRPSGATKPSSEKPVPLDLKDSNAWPEVGVGLFSPNKSKGKGKLNNEEDGTVKENESPSKSIKVKSKSRWVAIPAEELQAAADAAAISRRQQARSQSVPKNSANNESQSHSRNQSHSRDSSLNRLPTSQKLARTGSKSVSRAGTSSGPHSRMHSRSTSAHESPAASREVGLPPQETEELTLVEEIRSHTTSSSHESTLRTSTYTVPSATSPLPSVFPVQIQQQQQQLKANTSVASGAATSFEAQSAYLPNGHFSTMEFTPASESAPPPQSPTTDQNLSHHPPPHPPSSHSPNMLSPAMMSYTPPYPFYSPYEYPSHPGMSHQMYWSSNGGSGHQTPNYGASQPTQHYMMPYGLPPQPPYAQPTHNPNYYSDGQHLQQYGHIPYPLPISAEDSSAMRPRVLFGSFDGDERDLPTASESRLSFSVGLGPGEESLSKPRTRKRTGKKCTRWQKTAGVMMLNSDAEVVDLTERIDNLSSTSDGSEEKEMSRRWTFGRFGFEEQEVDEQFIDQGPSYDPHLVQPTPPHPSLPPAFIPVGAVPIPVPVPAPVPPIPLSSLSSLPPIHTHFPNPIPPHPSLSSHLGPFSAETVPTISPTVTADLQGSGRGEARSPMDTAGGGFNVEANGAEGDGSEWEVRDFGYGFGRAGKVGSSRTRDTSAVVEQQQQQRDQQQQPLNSPSHSYFGNGNGRPRRGSYSYNYPYAGYGERGGYSSRRGRGYGRGRGLRRGGVYGTYGYDTRDRDRDGYGPSPRGPRAGGSSHHSQQSFPPTPPQQFHSLPHSVENGLHTYIHLPTGYDNSFQPYPMLDGAAHFSQPPYPVYPNAQSLLKQLEYYFSPQNMARDSYLRGQMNRQGWIPVPLIASFPRVRRLTDNINDVREVLNMSSMVEVKEDMVRMKEWEHYLLPDEQSGHVDSINEFPQALSLTGSSAKVNRLVEEAVMKVIRDEGEGADTEEDEEEEEDVVFVMGQESGLWSPEAARS